MPVPRFLYKMRAVLAEECGISDPSALWCTDPTKKRMTVYFWKEKLTKKELDKLTGKNTAGSHLSARGKICRILASWNADGYITKIKPSEATADSLFPISPLTDNTRCSCCGNALALIIEMRLGRCSSCSPAMVR